MSLIYTKSCFILNQRSRIAALYHEKQGGGEIILIKSCTVIKIRKAVPLANVLVPSVVFPVTLMLFVYVLGALVKKMASGLMESSQIPLLCG